MRFRAAGRPQSSTDSELTSLLYSTILYSNSTESTWADGRSRRPAPAAPAATRSLRLLLRPGLAAHQRTSVLRSTATRHSKVSKASAGWTRCATRRRLHLGYSAGSSRAVPMSRERVSPSSPGHAQARLLACSPGPCFAQRTAFLIACSECG